MSDILQKPIGDLTPADGRALKGSFDDKSRLGEVEGQPSTSEGHPLGGVALTGAAESVALDTAHLPGQRTASIPVASGPLEFKPPVQAPPLKFENPNHAQR